LIKPPEPAATPFFLLSGMGADERVFCKQKEEFPHLIIPAWLPPIKGESLPEYAKRFAKVIDPGVPCVIGGASFGGMVAVEMLPHLQCKTCILIGSVSHPDQLPPIVKWARPFGWLTAHLPYRLVQLACRIVNRLFGGVMGPYFRFIFSQAQHSPGSFFEWAIPALLQWRKTDHATDYAPLLHIHGDRDPVLGIKYVKPNYIIVGGGHVISYRNSREVNRLIHQVLRESPTPSN